MGFLIQVLSFNPRRDARCKKQWDSPDSPKIFAGSKKDAMKTQNTNQGAVTRAWRGYLPILLMLLTLVSTALAGNGSKHGPKAAPDIDNFPVNPDGTVSVIVQLSPGTPPGQVKNFAKKINQNLTTISAVAANVPLDALDKL